MIRPWRAAGFLAMCAGVAMIGCNRSVEARAMPETDSHQEARELQDATFAAGCFWGVEATFSKVPGVVSTEVGYTGGTSANPTYEDVCSHTTGHAEAVHLRYDPEAVTYEQLLSVFWQCHDPTSWHRQGPDVGSQYRSAIFFHTPEQEAAATASKRALDESGQYDRPVVTEIVAAPTFYRAEEYHQGYLAKRGLHGCRVEL